VAVAHQLRCKACEPHTCVCGKSVDARGLHGLSCLKITRQQRHSHRNDIIWRATKWAQVPAVKELYRNHKPWHNSCSNYVPSHARRALWPRSVTDRKIQNDKHHIVAPTAGARCTIFPKLCMVTEHVETIKRV